MITQDELKELVIYNEKTGKFTLHNGKPTGWIDDKGTRGGYVRIALPNKQYLAHRLAWLYVHGVMPECIDHINRVRTDNRICNLKVATLSDNARNRSIPSNNTSSYPGVSIKPNGKWIARIVNNLGQRVSLGTFIMIEDAIEARKRAEKKYGYTSH